jgi:hypothetical protein
LGLAFTTIWAPIKKARNIEEVMKKILIVLIAIIYFNLSAFAQADQVPPTAIIKPTLSVRAALDRGYWKLPEAKNYWSWMPQVAFTMTGPVEDASFVTFEFFTPDGKPWYSWDTAPMSVPAGQIYNVESEGIPSWKDKRSTILTGKFGFKITLKNNLNGTAKELYKGSFVAGKKFAGTPHPDFKNQWAYYVDQDWTLPIGYAAFDRKQDANSSLLNVSMWFRGEMDSSDLAAYLFYNGKQISSTKVSSQGYGNLVKPIIHEGDDNDEVRWELWRFSFFNIRSVESSSYPDAFVLKKNPGSYEVKVLLDGELVRTTAFAIGADGRIVDDGTAAKNGFGAFGTVVPVKITATKEKIGNLQAWKTDAFYGNPLVGFNIQ